MTKPTPHGQVPEALIDLIDAYAETRHRYGRIYNARTEAARNAVIEDLREALGGVQALSAAPAERQAAPKAAPGELSADSLRHQNKLLAETLGACILASGIVRKDIDGFTGPELLHFGEDLRSMLEVAPKQEVQEPAFWMNEKGHTWSHSDWKQFPKHRAKYPIPLYAHRPPPQPAPDCHHRPPCDECAAIAAQGGKV